LESLDSEPAAPSALAGRAAAAGGELLQLELELQLEVEVKLFPRSYTGSLRDLRVTVSTVLGQLAGGRTVDDVLSDYPYLERADVLAALEYASVVVNEREVPVARPA